MADHAHITRRALLSGAVALPLAPLAAAAEAAAVPNCPIERYRAAWRRMKDLEGAVDFKRIFVAPGQATPEWAAYYEATVDAGNAAEDVLALIRETI